MKQIKFLVLYLIYCISCFVVCLQGCTNLTDGNDSEYGSHAASIPYSKPETVIAFDQKLSQIENQESAEEAVQYFADYALSNQVERTYTPTTISDEPLYRSEQDSSPINADLVRSFASIEVNIRSNQHNKDTSSLLKNQAPGDTSKLVTISKLTSIVNQLKMMDNVGGFSEDEIRQNQRIIRENIPHLASQGTDLMTPLEASVIMYFIVTGDNGAQPEGSIPLMADNEDIQKFMVMLTD